MLSVSDKMDSRKILAIVIVIIVAAASAGIIYAVLNHNDTGELKVAYLKKNGYETLMVAEEKGFFNDAGIKIDSVPVTGSGQNSVNALLAGEVDIAATGQGPVAATLKDYLDDTVIVCAVNYSTGGQVWVSKAGTGLTAYNGSNAADVKSSFQSFVDTNGRPVNLGVQQGATTESEIKGWLKLMEIPFADFGASTDGKLVKLVNQKANMLVTDLDHGDIDVMAASQPFPSNAVANVTGSYVLGSNKDTGSYDVACYITTKAIYDEKKDLIEKFIKGLDLASKYMADPANNDECVSICTEIIGTNTETVQAAFDIANWKVDWSDAMAHTLFETCKKKGISVDEQTCRDKCLFKDYLATL